MNRRQLLRAILAAPGFAIVPVEVTPLTLLGAKSLQSWHGTPTFGRFSIGPERDTAPIKLFSGRIYAVG